MTECYPAWDDSFLTPESVHVKRPMFMRPQAPALFKQSYPQDKL